MSGSQPHRKILIVDDDDDFTAATSRAIALEGVECIIARNGAEAVAAVQFADIEIALLDIRIGHEDGTELAGVLRGLRPDLVLVLMTAYASVDSAVAALKVGAYDYLRKPFFLDEIMRALERCFELVALRRAKLRAEHELAMIRQLDATSQLAAGLSHDFRNMLAVVRANLAVIHDGLHARDVLWPYARDAKEAAATAEALVARLMDFTRGPPAAEEAIDLRVPVSSGIAMMRRSLCAGMDLTLELPDFALLAPIKQDQLETAIINLLINSRDATGGTGRATVSLQHYWRGADYARLVVCDDGPGLAPEALEHALQVLFTTKSNGTGLGLPMIRQMALLAGGDFWLENAEKGGARAVLDLPCLSPVQGSGRNI